MYLETTRCIIRPFLISDASDLLVALSDPDVMRYVEPPFDLERTKSFIQKTSLTDSPLTYALFWKATETVIGHVIFHPYPGGGYEIGWILRKDFWGMGIASEVTTSLLTYAKAKKLRKCAIECHRDQHASQRIAEKHGFHLIGIENDCLNYELDLVKTTG